MQFSGCPLSSRCVLKFVMLCSNNVSQELVLSSLRTSPLMNLLFTPVDGRLKNIWHQLSFKSFAFVNNPRSLFLFRILQP